MKPSVTSPPGATDDVTARDLARLRGMAMNLAGQIEQAVTETLAAPSAPSAAETDPPPAAKPLGKVIAMVAAFAALARIVIQIVDQERRIPRAAAPFPTSKQNEQPFGQRIAAELDRVAARARAAGVPGRDGDMPPRRDRPD